MDSWVSVQSITSAVLLLCNTSCSDYHSHFVPSPRMKATRTYNYDYHRLCPNDKPRDGTERIKVTTANLNRSWSGAWVSFTSCNFFGLCWVCPASDTTSTTACSVHNNFTTGNTMTERFPLLLVKYYLTTRGCHLCIICGSLLQMVSSPVVPINELGCNPLITRSMAVCQWSW